MVDVNEVKRFSSKRNRVILLENEDNLEVIKNFYNEEFYKRELTIYKILKNEYSKITDQDIYKIAPLLDINEEELFIKYQYIYGDTLLSSFEHYEVEYDIKSGIRLMSLLFQWIKKFQIALTKEENIELLSLVNIDLNKDIIAKDTEVVSLIDINFRNFILSEDALYGIDFENVAIDLKIKDYARSLAFMMLYNPIKSRYKNELIPYLLEEIENITNISKDEIYNSYINEVKIIERRRTFKK